jgi:hypothetical protein
MLVGLVCLLGSGYQAGQQVDLSQQKSPTQQAISWFKQQQSVRPVATNYGVNLFRAALANYAIYDSYYPSSLRALRTSPVGGWQLSGTILSDRRLITLFPARFAGEKPLYLYQIKQPKDWLR